MVVAQRVNPSFALPDADVEDAGGDGVRVTLEASGNLLFTLRQLGDRSDHVENLVGFVALHLWYIAELCYQQPLVV